MRKFFKAAPRRAVRRTLRGAVLTLLLTGIFLFSSAICVSAQPPELSARAAALMIADTGELVFSGNGHERLPMASTTKIMTALLTLEHGLPDAVVTVTPEMVAVEGSSMGLLAGDSVSLRTLVSGMLLESGNDAANAAACAVSGSLPAFVERMNAKARELGLQDTSFATPSGLDAEGHFSTACDLALLGCHAVQNPEFLRICSQRSETVRYGNPPYRRTLTNHNRLLSTVEGCVGIKTGFTKKSGRCLVSAVTRDSITLVAVTLSAPDDWNDHAKLYEYGFSRVKMAELPDVPPLRLPVVGSETGVVGAALLYRPHIPTAGGGASAEVKLCLPAFEYAPVAEGEPVGTASYLSGGRVIAEVPLVAVGNAPLAERRMRRSFRERLRDFFNTIFPGKERAQAHDGGQRDQAAKIYGGERSGLAQEVGGADRRRQGACERAARGARRQARS